MSQDEVDLPTVRTSLKGGLLIAMPRLADPNFHRTVTLIVSHDDQGGAFGIVLGKLTRLAAHELGEPLGLPWQRDDVKFVRYGGPCERPRIWLMHGGETPLDDAVTIAPGVHLGSSPDLLRELNRRQEIPLMIFSGYAGWAPGQLEREIQENSWLPGEVTPALVFNTTPEDVWEAALRLSELSPDHIGSGSGASA